MIIGRGSFSPLTGLYEGFGRLVDCCILPPPSNVPITDSKVLYDEYSAKDGLHSTFKGIPACVGLCHGVFWFLLVFFFLFTHFALMAFARRKGVTGLGAYRKD